MNSDKPVALVTGAATGIGRSAALALARSGYHVVINYSRSEKAAKTTARDAEAAGARTLVYRCDVSDDACVRTMLEATEKEFGRLDVLINNAGTTIAVVCGTEKLGGLNGRGLEPCICGQRPRDISRHPCCRADAAPVPQRVHRQHVQHCGCAPQHTGAALRCQ